MKGLGIRNGDLQPSNDDGHGYTTIEAYQHAHSFYHYINTNHLINTLLKYVAETDISEENYHIAHLPEEYPHVNIWTKDSNPDDVYHCYGGFCENLCDDPRLHNSIECLKLALERKPIDPTEAIRILANGMHLIQDYFVHLNSPGLGNTGVSHGVNVMIDSDGDSIPDTYAGRYVDNINWDCHSSPTNISEHYNLQSTDLFQASFWHYHQNRSDCWRYLAALYTTAHYMTAFDANDSSMYIDSLAKGTVPNGETPFHIDLLSNMVRVG